LCVISVVGLPSVEVSRRSPPDIDIRNGAMADPASCPYCIIEANQHRIRSSLRWVQGLWNSIRPVLLWRQSCVSVASGWLQLGISPTSARCLNDVRVASEDAKSLRSTTVLKELPLRAKDVPSRSKDPPSRSKDLLSRSKGPPSRSKDPPSRSKNPPSRYRDLSSRSKVLLSRSKDPPSRSKAGPSRSKDLPSRSKDPPSRSKDLLARFKDPPSRSKDPPLNRNISVYFTFVAVHLNILQCTLVHFPIDRPHNSKT
jgi:hypothetical protein